MTRPPHAKLTASLLQSFNEGRKPHISWRVTAAYTKLRQYRLCDSLPVHRASAKLLIREHEPDNIALLGWTFWLPGKTSS